MLEARHTLNHPPGEAWRVFSDDKAFARHMLKHVFSAGERGHWACLFKLHEPPWRALDTPDARRLLAAAAGAPQAAYDQFAAVVDEGLHHAVTAPARIRVEEHLAGLTGSHQCVVDWLLAKEGFLVCARGGVVRSAFFCVDDRDTSAWTRYRHGLRGLRARALQAAAGQRHYRGSDNRWATVTALEVHAAANFSNAANPWPRPKRPKPPPPRERDRGFWDWLDKWDQP